MQASRPSFPSPCFVYPPQQPRSAMALVQAMASVSSSPPFVPPPSFAPRLVFAWPRPSLVPAALPYINRVIK